jgi:phosphoglycolate phosphatase
VPRKPAPDSVFSALEQLNVPVTQAVYVGDSEVDFQTAKNAGMDCILVSWGFRDKSVLEGLEGAVIVDTGEALMAALNG